MIAQKFKIAILIAVLACGIAIRAEKADKNILVEYFYQPNCEECEKISALILPPTREKFGSRLTLRQYDLSQEKNFLLLISILDKLDNASNQNVYMILDRRYVLAGYPLIESELLKQLDLLSGVSVQSEPVSVSKNSVRRLGGKLTFGAILLAGLLDGINPCVFSTLIFFMSLLSVAGITGRRLLAIGTVYCFACFTAYLLLGFGLFNIIRALAGFPSVKQVLNLSMAGVLILFAVLSFRDSWVYVSSGNDARKVALQLPDFLKTTIHRIMRKGLKTHYLLGGTCLIGVLVTLLESVCTGQVYVPTLVLLSNETGIFSRWFSWLLLYNLMFISPLIGVFILFYCGISTFQAVKLTRKNLIIGKLLLGVFFTALAAVLLLI